MRIDVHAHYYPTELTKALGGQDTVGGGASSLPMGRVSLDERIDMLTDVGIELQVLSVGANQPYFTRHEEALAAARFANDLYADVSRGHGGRLAAFGAMPLPHVDEAIDELGRCVESLGLLGVNLGCSVNERPLDDPAFEPFFRELDRRGAVLFLHPCGIGAPMTDAYGLSWMVGGCFEDTVASLRLVMSGLTTRYPNVRIIVPHLGGTLPFLMQRIEDSIARRRLRGGDTGGPSPTELIRSLYFDTVNNYPVALRCACEAFGAEHIILGTDFPYLTVEECVTYVQQSGLPQEDIDAILDGNAERLLLAGTGGARGTNIQGDL